MTILDFACGWRQHREMAKKVVFSSEEDDKLVEAVAPNRVLYDAAHPEHKKYEVKNKGVEDSINYCEPNRYSIL